MVLNQRKEQSVKVMRVKYLKEGATTIYEAEVIAGDIKEAKTELKKMIKANPFIVECKAYNYKYVTTLEKFLSICELESVTECTDEVNENN